jgi:hypothetical protein
VYWKKTLVEEKVSVQRLALLQAVNESLPSGFDHAQLPQVVLDVPTQPQGELVQQEAVGVQGADGLPPSGAVDAHHVPDVLHQAPVGVKRADGIPQSGAVGDHHVPGVYNLPNKTHIPCGKISETFWENVEAYSKTANDKSTYCEILKACLVSISAFTFYIGWVCERLDTFN